MQMYIVAIQKTDFKMKHALKLNSDYYFITTSIHFSALVGC